MKAFMSQLFFLFFFLYENTKRDKSAPRELFARYDRKYVTPCVSSGGYYNPRSYHFGRIFFCASRLNLITITFDIFENASNDVAMQLDFLNRDFA